MRSGTKASRIFSCGRVRTVGSTRATTDWPATVASSRISAPSGYTTSTTASKVVSPSVDELTRRSSGRTPRVTG
jgi:hypothetical protein